jgi:hypothetical protein
MFYNNKIQCKSNTIQKLQNKPQELLGTSSGIRRNSGGEWVLAPPQVHPRRPGDPEQPPPFCRSPPVVTCKNTQKATRYLIFIFFLLYGSVFFFFGPASPPLQICFSILVWLFFPALNGRSGGCGVGCRRWSLR